MIWLVGLVLPYERRQIWYGLYKLNKVFIIIEQNEHDDEQNNREGPPGFGTLLVWFVLYMIY